MEPWDGPAAVAFTDGRMIGATLDRNGLRLARYLITDDDVVLMASEMGVLPIPQSKIIKKWRLQPGKMFLIDMVAGRIVDDAELKHQLSTAKPYRKWIEQSRYILDDLPKVANKAAAQVSLLDAQQAFGYTQEDLKFIMLPMATAGEEATGSMGSLMSALRITERLLGIQQTDLFRSLGGDLGQIVEDIAGLLYPLRYGFAVASWFFSSPSSTMRPACMSIRNILPGCKRHFLTILCCGISSTPISEAISTMSSSVIR